MNPYPQAKNEVRALFFDMDGTLLSFSTHTIPQSAVDALLRAHKAGYRLFVATGRHETEMAQIDQMPQLPFEAVLTANGQYCRHQGELIHSIPLPPQDMLIMSDYLKQHPHPCLFATENDIFITRINDVVKKCHAAVNTGLPPLGVLEEHIDKPIYHAGIYLRKGATFPIMEQMTGCNFSRWSDHGDDYGLDVIAKDGGKWNGILQTAEYFGIAPEEIMVFGDSDNDLEMLKNATYSVAMGSGTPEAIAAAGYTAPALDEDGIAYALRELLDI